jgi:hypothetical protein
MKILFAALMAFSTAVSAAEVKITSFVFIKGHGANAEWLPLAEICGQAEPATGKPEMIKIVSDPKSKNPAHYFAWAGKEGKFCTTIITYSGLADASIE